MSKKRIMCLDYTNRKMPEYHMAIFDNFSFETHTHKGFFEIDYVWQGIINETINGSDYAFSPGTLILIRPGDIHNLSGKNIKLSNILFDKKLFETSKLTKWVARQKDILYVTIPEKARSGMEAAINELFIKQNLPEGELLSNRFFYDIMIEWFIPQEKAKHTPSPEWLQRGIAEIESTDPAGWSVNSIVKSCCKTREHVARTFQAVFECSISQYINQARLEKARKQLIYTNMPISDICFDCGFNNINYFYRLFKNFSGITPADYRKKNFHTPWDISGRSSN